MTNCGANISLKPLSKCPYTVLVGKHEGKRLLEMPRRRRESNIKMDLQKIVREGLDWIGLT
jgi:hypothetical protein